MAPGESFGFLGPNGAGKTSTMRMIGCVSPISGGTLEVMGMDPAVDGPRIRASLGVVPQQDTLDLELTVRENLSIYGRYFGLSRAEVNRRADELLEFAQLTERADDQVEPLSGGMKRRLTIARSLINEPTVLLLDEPTTGLDPQARHLLWDRLYRLKQRGVTLVLTTHYMDEAEQLCDRLVVMDKAKIVAEGSPRELIERYSTREVTELRFAPGRGRDARRPARRHRPARRAPARPRPALRRRRRGGGGRRPPARPQARVGARPPVVARGRLPAPDRALADRLGAPMTSLARPISSSAIGRVFEHRFLSYRRTFRASIFSSFLSPVLFLAAMGIGLGAYVSDPTRDRRRAVPRLPGARAAGRDRRCSRPRSRRCSRSWPGSSGTGSSTRCTRRRSRRATSRSATWPGSSPG